MKRRQFIAAAGGTLFLVPLAEGGERETNIVYNAEDVLDEITAIPARSIPVSLLRRAQGIAIFPGVVKAGFVVGVRHGHGIIVARDDNGAWSNPVFLTITGGSLGWQAGAQSTDIVLVFMNMRGVREILRGRQFALGVDAAIAAGPIGRQAEADTDARLQAEIYSYSRSRGLFVGVSLGGSQIKVDRGANAYYYNTFDATPEDIVAGVNIQVPRSAAELKEMITRYASEAPRRRRD
ncbi:MAG: lipid-binding SYLF domain-containing protein [Planctomycetota bacterium]